jgi:hypothetical protein
MTPILGIHAAAGCLAIASGTVAASTRKGGQPHRMAGQVFVVSMFVMAGLGSMIAVTEPKASPTAVGVLTLYLVLTGWRAGRRHALDPSGWDRVAAGLGGPLAASLATLGVRAFSDPDGTLDKAPFLAFFVFASIAAFTALLDLKVAVQGLRSAKHRLRRHLWRMSVAFFFSSAFFFLGQQQVMPKWLRGSPALYIPALAPLVLLAYWLVAWRSRERRPYHVAIKIRQLLASTSPRGGSGHDRG